MTKATQQAADYRFEKTNETPRTVRVRIAVAIDAEEHWAAYGWGTGEKLGRSVFEMLGRAADMIGDHDGVILTHWIEADVPLPATQTIRGEIVS